MARELNLELEVSPDSKGLDSCLVVILGCNYGYRDGAFFREGAVVDSTCLRTRFICRNPSIMGGSLTAVASSVQIPSWKLPVYTVLRLGLKSTGYPTNNTVSHDLSLNLSRSFLARMQNLSKRVRKRLSFRRSDVEYQIGHIVYTSQGADMSI